MATCLCQDLVQVPGSTEDQRGRGCGSRRLQGSGLPAPKNDVETVPQGPLRLGQSQVKIRDQPGPGGCIRNGLKNRIEGNEGIAGKVHLRHQARHQRGPEQREMNVCRSPRVVMIPPGVGSRPDGREAVAAILAGHASSGANEIGVEGRGVIVARVTIAASCVGLPDLDERSGDGPAILVEHASGHDDALTLWLALALACKVVVGFADRAVAK